MYLLRHLILLQEADSEVYFTNKAVLNILKILELIIFFRAIASRPLHFRQWLATMVPGSIYPQFKLSKIKQDNSNHTSVNVTEPERYIIVTETLVLFLTIMNDDQHHWL